MAKEKEIEKQKESGSKPAIKINGPQTEAKRSTKTLGEVTVTNGKIEPKPAPANSGEPIINSTSLKKRKLSANRDGSADKLLVPPPKSSAPATPRKKAATPAPSKNGPTEPIIQRVGGKPASLPIPPANSKTNRSTPEDFHKNDRLPSISPGVRQEIYGILLLVTGVIIFIGLLNNSGALAQAGMFVKRIFGIGAFLIPILIIVIGATHFYEGLTQQEKFNQTKITAAMFMIIAFICLVHLFAANPVAMAEKGEGGGYLAHYLTAFLSGLITPFGTFLVLIALFLVGFIITFNISLRQVFGQVRNSFRAMRGEKSIPTAEPDEFDDFDLQEDYKFSGGPTSRTWTGSTNSNDLLNNLLEDSETEDDVAPALAAPLVPPSRPVTLVPEPIIKQPAPQRPLQQSQVSNIKPEREAAVPSPALPRKEWQLPVINILASFSDVEINHVELRKKAKMIESTLGNFGVSAFVREINTGPTVTQYALEPDTGVKVAKIVALQNDLALALAAPSIRMEAPVPGQSRVGIEVPNAKVATVGLRELMESDEFIKKQGKLKIALGRDVAGQPITPDLAKMPHLLIAGSTGSGKSVCVNTIIASLLFYHRPDELQFIMIDPKMVELSTYNGIPHLRFPVVTQIEADPEEERRRPNDRTPTVMSVLKWAIREMEKRYKHLSFTGHRNIESYNKVAGVGNDWEKLSYLVLIIDELADLMMVAPEEAENAICRLAQKARAVGIHLILATQRPSVDVVTGLIKANFPSRITFAVTSQIDSRVILDTTGAEKLLGRGDMLYLPSDAAKPFRCQGTYVSDEEIDALVKFWRSQNDFLTKGKDGFDQVEMWPKDLREIEAERGTSGEDGPDDMFEPALEIVREARTASVSLLQRRLRIGYNRAARLIEELEQAGVIGRGNGSQPRPVLLDEEDLSRANTSLTAAASMPLELTPGQKREREAALNAQRAVQSSDIDDDPPL